MLSILKKLIPRGQFGKNVLLLAGGTAITQVIAVMAIPFLTRLYSPEDFGILAIYVSIIYILMTVCTLRYEWAIPLPKDAQSAAHLLLLSLMILLIIVVIVTCAIFFINNYLKLWGGLIELQPYLWFIPLSLLGAGCYQILNMWAIRNRRFRPIAKTKVTQTLGQVFTQLSVGFFSQGPIGLLLGDVIGRSSGSGILGIIAWQKDQKILTAVNFSGIKRVFRRYYKVSLYSTGSALLNTSGLQVTPLFLAVYYGSEVAGWFALTQRVITMPLNLLGNAIFQPFFAEAAKLVDSDPIKLRYLYLKISKKMFIFGLILALPLLFAPWLFEMIFGGTHWKTAGVYAQYMIPLLVTQIAVSPVSHLIVHERQQWQFFWDMGRLTGVCACLLGGVILGWTDTKMILIYSLLMSILYGILYAMNLWALSIRIKMKCQP